MSTQFTRLTEEESQDIVEEDQVVIDNGHNADDLPPPPDNYKLAYFIFLMLGAGVLVALMCILRFTLLKVPWISMLTAVDYFTYLFPNYNFEFNLSVAYMYPNCITLMFLTSFGNRISIKLRIIGGFVIFILCFFIVGFVDDSVPRDIGFAFTMIAAAVFGFCDAGVQGTIYGYASFFPPLYTQAVQGGTGAAGFIVSGSRIITKAALPDTPEGLRASSMIYFGFSILFILICMLSFLVLEKLPISLHYVNKIAKAASMELQATGYNDSFSHGTDWRKANKVNIKGVFSRMWPLALAVWTNFFITLFIFPGLISIIPSTRGEWSWFPVILISLYNFTDFLGKITPRWFLQDISDKNLYILTGSKIIFFPLFMLCVNPRVLASDAIPVIMICLFGWLTGFIGSLTMMRGPTKVDLHEKEQAGTLMAFSLVFGLTVGATCAWAIPWFV